jgi:hypothetical protein
MEGEASGVELDSASAPASIADTGASTALEASIIGADASAVVGLDEPALHAAHARAAPRTTSEGRLTVPSLRCPERSLHPAGILARVSGIMKPVAWSALGITVAASFAACSTQGSAGAQGDAGGMVDASQAVDAPQGVDAPQAVDAPQGVDAPQDVDASAPDGDSAVDAATMSETPALTHLGGMCATNTDCASGTCAHSVCTRACASQSDCPAGFDCGLAVSGDTAPTCFAVHYDTTSPGGFGTSCTSVSIAPGGTMPCVPTATSPCASGFVCLAAAACDPGAVCTKPCSADTDCPPLMFCGTLADQTRLCMPRATCSDCAIDDQCPTGEICASIGSGRACVRTCSSQTDCPHAISDADGGALAANPFTCAAPPSSSTKVCAPASGSCHGPSAISTIQGDGQVCSGCRVGVPSDCAAGLLCFTNRFSTESYCTEQCTVDVLGSMVSNDTCPAGSFCVIGDPSMYGCTGSACSIGGGCGADPNRLVTTCHPN